MSTYVIRRLLLLLPVMWGVVTLTFVILRFLPGDAVNVLLADSQSANVAALRRELGLDLPWPQQYADFMVRSVTLDFGNSLISQRSVAGELAQAIPITSELAVAGVLITMLVAVPGGVIAAVGQDRISDYGARIFAFTFLSVPNFWVATMALVLPAMWFGWVPPLKYQSLFDDPVSNLKQFAMPAIIIGISSSAIALRMVRSQLLEVLRQDYVRTARAKGLSEARVVFGHALRNALIPTVTLFGAEFGGLLGGTVIIETIFGLPGVGRLMIQSISSRDYPQVQATVLFFAAVFVLVNLLVDLIYVVLDPRITYD